jgi:hypothetical protein
MGANKTYQRKGDRGRLLTGPPSSSACATPSRRLTAIASVLSVTSAAFTTRRAAEYDQKLVVHFLLALARTREPGCAHDGETDVVRHRTQKCLNVPLAQLRKQCCE